MKKTFLLMLAFVATLCASATDRFYIEDFFLASGDTCTVSIMLDNETAYTAFQCDLCLPEGLTMVPGTATLTSRKHNSHTFSVNTIADGVIRLMSYSLSLKTYSGNSGALVTLDIAASEDFDGPATVEVRNSLFTMVTGVEMSLANEQCTVTSGLWGDVNHDHEVNIADVTVMILAVLTGDFSTIDIFLGDLNGDEIINIADVTLLINYVLTGSL